MSFVKIYRSIFESSIWAEDVETRMVWLTLLIMADSKGRVSAPAPGIARNAGVSLAATERALDRLQQPDRHSKNQEHDGRRIVPLVEGSTVWQIVSYDKYRSMSASNDREENEHHALYHRNYRAAKAMERKVDKEIEESRGAKEICGLGTEGRRKKEDTDIYPPFEDFYSQYPKKTDRRKAEKKWRSMKKADREAAIAAIPKHVALWEKERREPRYIKSPLVWLNGACWEDDVSSLTPLDPSQRRLKELERERGL